MTLTTIVLISESKTTFLPGLQKRYTVYPVRSGKHGLLAAQQHQADVVVLDAASLKTTGERICRTLRSQLPETPIIHVFAEGSTDVDSAADTVLFMPFTWRKLANAVDRLLVTEEVDRSGLLRCGPFAMDTDRRVLIAHGNEIALTPKQALLVEIFLRRPGEVLERKWLMKQVWDTDYTGDTRTLDVHIRWVRRAIEDGAGRPQYLKTVRGVGYCLEVQPELETETPDGHK